MANKIPPVRFNHASPDVRFGQITDLLIGKVGYPLEALDKDYLLSRINNSVINTPEALRLLTVVGSKPMPESTEIVISHQRYIRFDRKHVINFIVDETNDINYEFMRQLHSSKLNKVLVWYIQNFKTMYGFFEGVEASLLLDHVIPSEKNELEFISGQLFWQGKYPMRSSYPLWTNYQPEWVVKYGIWNDAGIWIDEEYWLDSFL